MATLRPNPIAITRKRGHYRRRHEHLLAALICVGLAALLILASGLALSPAYWGKERPSINTETKAAQEARGKVIMVAPNDHCRTAGLNNDTGQLSEERTIPCPTPEMSPGYSYPAHRLAGIATGFLKGKH